MEVKDINTANTVQALFSKVVAGAVSGQSLGGGFASLIGQTTDAIISGKDNLNPVESNIKEKTTKPKEVEDEVSADEPKKDIKKQKKLKENPENNVAIQNNEEHSDVNVKQSKDAQSFENNVVADVKNTVSENKSEIDVAIENSDVFEKNKELFLMPADKLQFKNLDKTAVDVLVNSDVAVVVLSDGKLVFPQDVNLTDMIKQPVLNVFDETSGEIIQVSGEDFVAKIMQASNTENLFAFNTINEGFVAELQPLEVVDYDKRELSFEHEGADVLAQSSLADIDEVFVEQAKILNERITDKVEIKVDVKEEKNSYVADKDLIVNKMVLEDAVLMAEIDSEVVEQAGATTSEATKPNIAMNANNGIVQNQSPAAVMMQGPSLASDDYVMQSASVESIGSVAGSHSDVLNAPSLATENRIGNSTRSFEANNRDVYKGLSKDVIEQVKVNITKSAVKGVDKIDVRLKPEDLGNIEIKMQISKDGKLQAHITASRPETIEILRNEVQDLEKAFNDAGFKTDDDSFTFSFQNGQNENEQDQNAKLRSFIGSALEQEQENTWAENDNSQVWDMAQGLNIKV
ncbi:MAG: flagellar hook-length control protein FliK [Alphaproteobacteria bacterium]|nr:flagellar hook-length control protein FliK [Alphaproteobacteria bacterium]